MYGDKYMYIPTKNLWQLYSELANDLRNHALGEYSYLISHQIETQMEYPSKTECIFDDLREVFHYKLVKMFLQNVQCNPVLDENVMIERTLKKYNIFINNLQSNKFVDIMDRVIKRNFKRIDQCSCSHGNSRNPG